nr:hypothetical protein [Candidatus Sigynarchaeota archaeon]
MSFFSGIVMLGYSTKIRVTRYKGIPLDPESARYVRVKIMQQRIVLGITAICAFLFVLSFLAILRLLPLWLPWEAIGLVAISSLLASVFLLLGNGFASLFKKSTLQECARYPERASSARLSPGDPELELPGEELPGALTRARTWWRDTKHAWQANSRNKSRNGLILFWVTFSMIATGLVLQGLLFTPLGDDPGIYLAIVGLTLPLVGLGMLFSIAAASAAYPRSIGTGKSPRSPGTILSVPKTGDCQIAVWVVIMLMVVMIGGGVLVGCAFNLGKTQKADQVIVDSRLFTSTPSTQELQVTAPRDSNNPIAVAFRCDALAALDEVAVVNATLEIRVNGILLTTLNAFDADDSHSEHDEQIEAVDLVHFTMAPLSVGDVINFTLTFHPWYQNINETAYLDVYYQNHITNIIYSIEFGIVMEGTMEIFFGVLLLVVVWLTKSQDSDLKKRETRHREY